MVLNKTAAATERQGDHVVRFDETNDENIFLNFCRFTRYCVQLFGNKYKKVLIVFGNPRPDVIFILPPKEQNILSSRMIAIEQSMRF